MANLDVCVVARLRMNEVRQPLARYLRLLSPQRRQGALLVLFVLLVVLPVPGVVMSIGLVGSSAGIGNKNGISKERSSTKKRNVTTGSSSGDDHNQQH